MSTLTAADKLLQPGGEVAADEPAPRWAYYRLGAFMQPTHGLPQHGPLPDVEHGRCDPRLFAALISDFPWAWPQFRSPSAPCVHCRQAHRAAPTGLCPGAAADYAAVEALLCALTGPADHDDPSEAL